LAFSGQLSCGELASFRWHFREEFGQEKRGKEGYLLTAES
jgi:hypothetical protein